MKVEVSRIYGLHPLPHGLQHQQVVQLLRDWQWQAKPLQPSRGFAEGGSWEVGATTEPSANVMTAFNQDVLISLLKNKMEADKTPTVVGPSRAQRHLRTHAAGSSSSSTTATDPWLLPPCQDPWHSYKGMGQVKDLTPSTTPTSWQCRWLHQSHSDCQVGG